MPFRPDSHLLLTCVHFHDAAAVAAFAGQVASLPTPEGMRVSLAIADNSADWPADTRLPEIATVFCPGENRGYLAGCYHALDRWQAREGRLPDWTGVLNTDLVLDQQFLTSLFGLPMPAAVGVLAPDVRLPDGSAQNPFLRRRPKRHKVLAYTYIFRSLALTSAMQWLHGAKRLLKRRRATDSAQPARGRRDLCQEIYAPHGSIFFLRDSYFLRGGTLDYPGFMYGEELFIAEQARRIGLRTVWVPAARVAHMAHAATGAVASRRRLAWMHESVRIAWKNDFCGS